MPQIATALSVASSAIGIGTSIASLFSKGPKSVRKTLPSTTSRVRTPPITSLTTPGFQFGTSPGTRDFNLVSRGTGQAELERLVKEFGLTAEQAQALLATSEELRGPTRGLATQAQSLRGQAEERFGSLIDQVRPGFGRLTESTRDTFSRRSAEAVGNLRESLARRRVLGSSFANDAEARTRLEFAAEEERALSEATINELALTADFTDRLFSASLATLQAETNAIALELGLNQQQAGLLNTNITAIREQRNTVVAGISAELAQFQLGSGFALSLQSLADQNARFDIAAELKASGVDLKADFAVAEAKGESLNTLTRGLGPFGEQLGDLFNTGGAPGGDGLVASPGIGSNIGPTQISPSFFDQFGPGSFV